MSNHKKHSVVFTVCSANYLLKALGLCISFLDHNSGTDITIVLVDTKRPVDLRDGRVRLLWAEDLHFPDYLRCAFKYNVIELNTALKPWTASILLRDYEKVVYLDPDVCVFGSLDCVFSQLDDHATLFTPHALSPYLGIGRPNDRDLLRFGACNLGFFAVNNSTEARSLLSWWHDQCRVHCYYEPILGLGVDQKWIDLAPSFFNDIATMKNPGLNVAFWNLHERFISTSAQGWFVNQDTPLIFIHFSSFVEEDRLAIAGKQTRYLPGSRPDFVVAADVYREYLDKARSLATVDPNYGYGRFDDGAPISLVLRRLYATLELPELLSASNPFESGGPVQRFAHRYHLIGRQPAAGITIFRSIEDYKVQRRLIALLFRFALRVLGPERYFALTRYLGHYASILNQNDLFQ